MNPAAGGPCQGIRNSIPSLLTLGCESEVVCMDAPNETFGMDDPFIVHRIGRSRGPWAYSSGLLPWLMQNLTGYDAVIIHGLWLYHSYAVTRAIKKLSQDRSFALPKVFVMPHGMLDPWFQRDPSRRLKAIRNWFVWKLVEQRVIARADAVLYTCQKELELAREPFQPYRPQQEINVGYGVAKPPEFDPCFDAAFRTTVPDLDGRPYLLFLSRIHPKKGVDLLLRAYTSVLSRANGLGKVPALVIAGPLDSDYARQMQQFAADLKLSDVHFPGMLSGDAKWGAFYGCDAFVLPSHQENFGIAVVEALACGKPVLISNQVNIYNDIESDGAAYSETDTPEGTESLLRAWLSTNEASRQAMSTKALECYQARYLPAAAAGKFLQAIDRE
ncbi:glycosyltransferase [Rhodopirellula sp. JC740]|uniref:Glycosyltransferase n=1 Tax=Rhodopirellula halodulae TaxID=2894198 RepID=A0ABS8NJS5_9BACT|nr:glycosyltransferase [Rhodopirellula sp. JC740]MCC9642716.1 glycosyltransferase [Rhodopirellula sp. JC740]